MDANTRWRMASMVYGHEQTASLKSQPELAFNDATDRAWEALAWSWQARLGIPLANLYSSELIDTGLTQTAYHRTVGSSFTDTPTGMCWVFHEFDLKKIDGAFLKEWAETGEPRIIFNYRDPRDTILSLVNYLCRRTAQGLSAFNNLPAFSDILLAKPSLDERLTFALTDVSFPCQASDFERMAWLLHHPNRDYSGVSQLRLLDGILRRRHEYAAGLIMVNEAHTIRADLARFCARAAMPVIFIDAELAGKDDAYPPRTAFVGCDDAQIGTAAGRWVADHLRREHIKRPTVLVINGGHYQQREHAFGKQLESEIQDVQLIASCGKFDRVHARDAARTQLRRLEADHRKLHAVFCTNDEMALGVTDALLFSGIPWAKDTVVTGVDGTPDAKALIEADANPFRATVVQDSYKVAETAVGTMERMIRRQPVPTRTCVPAEILARD